MKVKTWDNIYKGLLILSAFYLIFSLIPPTVMFGVYVGLGCSAFNVLMILYTRYLIKQGRGNEERP